MLDPELGEWIAADEQSRQLRHWPAIEMNTERIQKLTVTHRG